MRGANFIAPEDVLVVLFNPNYKTAQYLQKHNLKKETVVEKFSKNPIVSYGKRSVLEKYGTDLTNEAKEGKLDPAAGRDKEIDRIIHILLRRTKNNPIIIGETGVGKTANLSSGGVCFSSQHILAVGVAVELSISWPVLLNGSCRMKVIIDGQVIRGGKETVAVAIHRYEFRTQGSGSR